MHHPIDKIIHTMAFVTHVEHWREREIDDLIQHERLVKMRLLFPISNKGSFLCTKTFVMPVVEQWLELEITHWVHQGGIDPMTH